MQEAEIVRGATIIPGAEATHGIEPSEVALDHPAVSAEPFRRLDAAPRNAMAYAPGAAAPPARG